LYKSLWLYLTLAAAVVWAFLTLQTPRTIPPLNAPAGVFSAQRAMVDVRQIAQAPHPTGSQDIVRVRNYLQDRLHQLGLNPEVHSGQGVMISPFRGSNYVASAAVQNLVAVLPGKDPAKPALVVMSHYDTVRNSPGAADDTAGVAASLEIARMLKAGPQPQRDVIFLITDAEEAGLLGAEAFFRTDPLAAHVGAVVNMEARGDSGLAAMFETGPNNAALIALYGQQVKRPSATSMASAVYHRMPNGTDLTIPIKKGLPGLNFAFMDDQLAYHSPLARPEHLDIGSLQHLGDQAGAMAVALAAAREIPKAGGDAVYGDVMGLFLLRYAPAMGWVVLGLSAIFAGIALFRAMGAGRATVLGLVRGFGVMFGLAAASGLLFELIGKLFRLEDYTQVYRALVHGEQLMAAVLLGGVVLGVAMAGAAATGKGVRTAAALALAGVVGATVAAGGFDPVATILGAIVAVVSVVALRRAITVWDLWGGALLLSLVLGAIFQALEPGVGPLIAWPLAVASLAALLVSLLARGHADRGLGLILISLFGFVGLSQVLAWGGFVFTAVGANMAVANIAIVLAAGPLLAPLYFATSRGEVGRAVSLAMGALALVCLGMVALGPNAQRPGLTQAFYLAEPAANDWRRATRLDLDDWSGPALGVEGGKATLQSLPPLIDQKVSMIKAAPAAGLVGPDLSATSQEGRVLVRLAPANQGEGLVLMIRSDQALKGGRLNGQAYPIEVKANETFTLTYEAPPPEGITLAFDAPPHAKLDLTGGEIRTGWPAGVKPAPSKPAHRMGWRWSDDTVTVSRRPISW
jgi:hypothetical protein